MTDVIVLHALLSEAALTAHCSLLTVHCLLLTACYSLLNTHCLLITAHCLLLTRRSLLATHCLLLTRLRAKMLASPRRSQGMRLPYLIRVAHPRFPQKHSQCMRNVLLVLLHHPASKTPKFMPLTTPHCESKVVIGAALAVASAWKPKLALMEEKRRERKVYAVKCHIASFCT